MNQSFREFLKDSIRKTIDFSLTEQSRGVTPPRRRNCVARAIKRSV